MKPPEPKTVLQDTFNDPAFGSRWEEFDLSSLQGPSQWSVQKGVLRQTSNCYTPNSYRGTMLISRASAAPPYRLKVRVRSSDPDRMGLVFGFKDPENHTVFWMSESRQDRALVQITDGHEERKAARRAGFQLSRWYDLELLVTREGAWLSIDGVPTLDMPTPKPLSGRVGLYAHANRGLEVSNFSFTRPIGRPKRPTRLQWQVNEEDGRQTIIKIANVVDQAVWINATARDQQANPVTPSYLGNLGGHDQWLRLEAGCSGTVILGPPMTRPGHGVCDITWRSRDPVKGSPLLISAYATDQKGLGWMIPVT